ncbi:MAG: ABC transporter permease subunit [Pseudomonadota bacterium]|nr:ABC transporter permease subunit [Pseudomonadota bacterium]
MKTVIAITKRELLSYFSTPVAYVFLVIFVVMNSLCTFYLGDILQRGQADLAPFFEFHPWLYMLLVPALSMRLWSEERKSGTIEVLLTLPITTFHAVSGKFMAAWLFSGLALAATFPIPITVNYLGNPDNFVILIGYFGSFLMAGSFLAIGSCISSFTQNQVIAFVVSFIICFLFNMSGFPIVLDFFSLWAPQKLLETISSFSFITHFSSISKGVLDIRDIIYFGSLILSFLFINCILVELKKNS